MAAVDEPGGRDRGSVSAGSEGGAGIRRDHDRGHSHQSTETKAAPKTTEFIAYLVVFAGILIASVVINGGDDSSDPDLFTADKAWLYITILTVGYMVSRGLAKSGSRDPYAPTSGTGGGSGIGERLGAAVEAFKDEPGSGGASRQTEGSPGPGSYRERP